MTSCIYAGSTLFLRAAFSRHVGRDPSQRQKNQPPTFISKYRLYTKGQCSWDCLLPDSESQRVLWQTVRVQSLLMEGVNTEPQPARSIRRCIALRKAPSWFNQDTEGLSKGFHILKSLKWTRDKGCEASAWIIFFKTWTFSCVGIVLKFSQNYCLWNYDYDLVKIKDCYLKKKLNDHLDCITDSTATTPDR